MRKVARPLIVLAMAIPSYAAAEPSYAEAIRVAAIGDGGVLALADGREICLAGVRMPSVSERWDKSAWQRGAQAIIDETAFFDRPRGHEQWDRYGCARATPTSAAGMILQHALLENGWAVVDAASLSKEASAEVMFGLEDRARQAGLGVWSDPSAGPKGTDDLADWIGTWQLVQGRVRRVSSNDRHVYLNFGADWRTDFTIRLDRKMIGSAGFDADDLTGRTVRARGVLQEARGPLMDIVNLKQIELLP